MTPARPPCPTFLWNTLLPLGIAVVLLAGPGHAAEDERDFTGTWKHVGGRAELRGVRDAIEASVADMTLVLRSLARNRLVKGSEIPKVLSIRADARHVAIRDGRRESLTSPPGEIVRRRVDSTGDEIELLHEIDRGALVQYRTTPDGGRRTTYHLDADGERLRVEVVTSSHYLPAPIRYELTYERISLVAAGPPDAD